MGIVRGPVDELTYIDGDTTVSLRPQTVDTGQAVVCETQV